VSAAGFTDRLVGELGAIGAEPLDPLLAERARQCLLDWLGVTLAGAGEDSARIAREVLLADGGGAPGATVVGARERTGARAAAFLNGIAAHALDYDDSLPTARSHASAPVVSAAVALAEARDADGGALLGAIVAGIEALHGLGSAVDPGHYDHGFHATGTVGTIGAAAACAHLLELDPRRRATAMSLAATQAAGLKAVFGTMGKHLNAAHAAGAGMLAAQLAAAGFTAPADALEAPQGFAATQAGPPEPHRAGSRPGIASVVFKLHACCHGTHAAIEGIRRLREQHGFAGGDVAEVVLRVAPASIDMCAIPRPATGLEGKFSLRYTAALALAERSTGPASFTDAMVHDPELVDLRDRVTVVAVPELAVTVTEVEVRLASGAVHATTADVLAATPDGEVDAQWPALEAKFLELATPIVGDERAAALLSAARALAAGIPAASVVAGA